jgi:hypothetical protein
MRKREMTLVIGISGLNPQWGFSQTSDDGLKNRGVTDIFVAGVANNEAVFKLLCPPLRKIAKKWTMSVHDWKSHAQPFCHPLKRVAD